MKRSSSPRRRSTRCSDGRVCRRAHRRAAAEHHRGAQRVRLHAADDRPAARATPRTSSTRRTASPPTSSAAGRGRGHDRDLRRAIRRLRLLPAEGQAGVPVDLVDLERLSGKGPKRSRPAGTPSSSSSGTTAWVPARWPSTTSAASAPGVGTLKVDGKSSTPSRCRARCR